MMEQLIKPLKQLWLPRRFSQPAPHTLRATIGYTTYGPDGKKMGRREFPAQSYVLACADILFVQMSVVAQSIPDTGNVARSVTSNVYNFNTQASGASTAYGIVVGTGTTAVALANYALVTLIAEGTGAGQLNYAASSYTAPNTSGSTRRFAIIRSMTNNSGASITINEIALYCQGGTSLWNFCIDRSLVSPGVAVANGATITWTYTIGVTV